MQGAYLDRIIVATRGRKRQEKILHAEGYPVLAIGKANTFAKLQIKPVPSNQSLSVSFNGWERMCHEMLISTIALTNNQHLKRQS